PAARVVQRGADRGCADFRIDRPDVLRLHEHADQLPGEAAVGDSLGVGHRPDPGFDADAQAAQEPAELDHARVGEVDRNKIRPLDPTADQLEPPGLVRLDPGCRAEPDRYPWGRLPDGVCGRVTRTGIKSLDAVLVARMSVAGSGACLDRSVGVGCKLRWGYGKRGMVPGLP